MSSTVSTSKIFIEAGKAIALAAIANAVLFFVLFASGMIDPRLPVSADGRTVTLVDMVITTSFILLIGTFVFWFLVRFTAQPARIFTWVCIAILLITLPMPFMFISNLPMKMGIALNILHLPPAYLLWRFLTRAV